MNTQRLGPLTKIKAMAGHFAIVYKKTIFS